MRLALHYMIYGNHNYNETARDYAYAKTLLNIIPLSNETKFKISMQLKGREFSYLHKENLSKSLKGVKFSAERNKKISLKKKGKPPYNKLKNEIILDVKNLLKDQYSINDISKKLNISYNSVYRIKIGIIK